MDMTDPVPVPNSAGTDRPRLEAPPKACDCHMHIYDAARFRPTRPGSRMQANASVEDYRRLQKRIGTERTVIGRFGSGPGNNRCSRCAALQ